MRGKANYIRPLLFAVFLLATLCAPATGKVIYVDDDAAGANDGSSWTDAFSYLQDALPTASAGDEIRVAQGIYTPTQDPLDREATFDLKDGVSVMGGYAGLTGVYPDSRNTQAFATILSGDIDHNDDGEDPNSKVTNSRHVVMCTGEGNAAVLEGVTVTSGHAGPPGQGHYRSDMVEGGGLYCDYGSSPRLIDCNFTDSFAGSGGAVSLKPTYGLTNEDEAREDRFRPVFTRCVFADNNAGRGGAVFNGRGWHPKFTHCLFENNVAEYDGGAIESYLRSGLNVKHCIFRCNSAGVRGGAISTWYISEIQFINCLFVANMANDSGGAIACSDYIDGTGGSALSLLNCTFFGNTSPTFYKPPTNSANQPDGSRVRWSDSVITNCIFYNSIPDEVSGIPVSIEFNLIEPLIIASIYESDEPLQGGSFRPTPDPLFVDPFGVDGIIGTEDDDFRLVPSSYAIDSGMSETDPLLPAMDLDSNPRIVSDRVDLGAYEFQGIIYVGGDVSENPAGHGTERHPLGSIQHAIDSAKDGYRVMVKPGVYSKIDFIGKAITVTGIEGAPVIEEPWDGGGSDPRSDAVTFHTGEGPGSVLKNVIIRNSGMGISLNYGSSPRIRNVTLVDNDFGIAAYENSNPDISNCILWNNRDGDLFQCAARYCCIESDVSGTGNISVDPLFADASNDDYHLKSEGWSWNTRTNSWTYDDRTSSCIDAGDPDSALGNELMHVPRDPNNEWSENLRINMGAYGGTSQASMPPLGWMPWDENGLENDE
jgi:parallel beta-helix repeat protein/predicted outer membrane repeat protein